MPAQAANLFLLEDLQYISGTRELAESDRNALRAVADWTKTFVARPHKDLGRDGLWPWNMRPFGLLLNGAPAGAVIQLIDGYKQLLLGAKPVDGDDANYKSIVV